MEKHIIIFLLIVIKYMNCENQHVASKTYQICQSERKSNILQRKIIQTMQNVHDPDYGLFFSGLH